MAKEQKAPAKTKPFTRKLSTIDDHQYAKTYIEKTIQLKTQTAVNSYNSIFENTADALHELAVIFNQTITEEHLVEGLNKIIDVIEEGLKTTNKELDDMIARDKVVSDENGIDITQFNSTIVENFSARIPTGLANQFLSLILKLDEYVLQLDALEIFGVIARKDRGFQANAAASKVRKMGNRIDGTFKKFRAGVRTHREEKSKRSRR